MFGPWAAALVDWNPSGLLILQTYRTGSKAGAYTRSLFGST
jgi:hypothetical protein